MKVHPRDLLPGSLIVKDVMGNTTYPIVPKNTVVEPIHIEVLNKFSIPYVEVAKKLADGSHYLAEHHEKKEVKPDIHLERAEEIDSANDTSTANQENRTFYDYYVDAVNST